MCLIGSCIYQWMKSTDFSDIFKDSKDKHPLCVSVFYNSFDPQHCERLHYAAKVKVT